jgi:hypothetical protein
MKKIRLFCIAAMLLFGATNLLGQVVITYSNHAPQVGQTITMKSLYSDFEPIEIDPGPAGAGVTWNFSTFVGEEESTVTFVNPALTPFADSVAGTGINLASEFQDEEASGYGFYTVNQQGMSINSFGIMESGVPFMYSVYDPAPKILSFPFAYENTYNTNGQIVFSYSPEFSMVNKEWATVTADAWGTLTNPTGTYNNVLRIKTHSVDSTFIYMNGQLFAADGYESLDYSWYSSDHRYLVQSIYGDLIGGVFEAWGVDYLVEESASVGEKFVSNLHVYPNPTSDVLFIDNANGQYILSDMLGRKVIDINAQGNHGQIRVDVGSLPEGIYILQEMNNNQVVSSAKVMIKR